MRLLLATLLLLPAACDQSGSGGEDPVPNPCENEDRADIYAPGMEVVGAAGTVVTLIGSVPAPPAKGDNTWSILVLDPAGSPLSDLAIDVIPIMPDHGHGTPVVTLVEPDADGGAYILDPVNLMMAGLWEVTLVIADAEGNDLDDVMFKFCVEE